MKQILLLALVGSAFLWGDRFRADEPLQEPVSAGKPLSMWIKDIKSTDFDTRLKAAEAIGRLGSRAKAAVPALKEALVDRKRSGPYRRSAQPGPSAGSRQPRVVARGGG